MTPKSPIRRSHWLTALSAALLLAGGCVSSQPDKDEQPPERSFDESTAFLLLDAAAAEAVDGLPDFPGFERRTMMRLECTHDGETDEEYVNLELSYEFSETVSEDPLVRETYLDLLRTKWEESGYDIHRDQPSGTGKHHSLEARRPDGVNYWYRVVDLVVLKVQSGCIKATGGFPDCPVPLGGVTRENDQANSYCNDVDTVYPGEETTSEAVAPFQGPGTAPVPFQATPASRQDFDGPPDYEGLL